MEPVRVRMYGLFPLTKRRYLIQAAVGAACLVAAFVGWLLASPLVRGGLTRPDLPPSLAATAATYVAFWDAVPWILLGAAAYKTVEVCVVLRLFSRQSLDRPAKS